MKLFPSQELPCRPGSPDYFTGTVWVDVVLPPNGPANMKAFRVSFEPGARTAWHTHPCGQALHVISGLGIVQLEGQRAIFIRPGDSVWIEPGEKHWHGAAPGRTMVHLAMQESDSAGVDAVWLEHVSDEQYSRFA